MSYFCVISATNCIFTNQQIRCLTINLHITVQYLDASQINLNYDSIIIESESNSISENMT